MSRLDVALLAMMDWHAGDCPTGGCERYSQHVGYSGSSGGGGCGGTFASPLMDRLAVTLSDGSGGYVRTLMAVWTELSRSIETQSSITEVHQPVERLEPC
ncbi:hypothetical protein VaNZ11_008794 [Volvox africanus]|uniref:Uncharacterized protein n=1 Tax=Volvox africanus TaxID=51714 RepID=A0ABQ5S6A1_9CHLO|nr:hypothetical protein VaNZ11_008794 [Volvox africanus]